MDLGRRRALGICSLPLWPLGFLRRILGMVSGTVLCAPSLCSGACDLVWWTWLGCEHRIRRWTGLWLVPAWIRLAVRAVVSRQPWILRSRECQQYADHEHH